MFSESCLHRRGCNGAQDLEGVCAEHGVIKKNLVASLQDMANKSLLDSRLLEWADSLRVLGNQGAHFTGDAVSREDASDALALAEAILDYLYVLTAQFEEFKQRRTKKGQGQSHTDGS
ncbi:DUF4145 domain-containing protein [Actinomadura sp. NBRC 104412]|uniref:DUF4145 domain-containing protein n=1 Tax=Actinomadura sp. NBRC 104412 TaxID=3032203 RepID=UPI002556A188|nr:DUF4145 domain-containing protein [Actinomadura sp. NBRC 104412]